MGKNGFAFTQKVRVNRRAKMSVKVKKDLRINTYKKIISNPQGNSIFIGQLSNYIWHVTMTNET